MSCVTREMSEYNRVAVRFAGQEARGAHYQQPGNVYFDILNLRDTPSAARARGTSETGSYGTAQAPIHPTLQ